MQFVPTDRPCCGVSAFCRIVLICQVIAAVALAEEGPRDYSIQPVPFSKVHVDDGFWTPRLETNRTVTIPYAFEQCEATDRISNFEKAAGLLDGKHEGIYFNDSDVYKVMEGAAYSLQVHPDRLMRLYLDQLIRIIAAAQWEDGYLFTFYSVPQPQPEKRWTNVASIHEQYCAGHMIEAAVAHYEVTGDETFLNVAKKNADLICQVFNAGNRTDPPGHQEIEIGLCKLFRVTGDAKYLSQAKFFLDQRGHPGHRGPDGKGGLYGIYSQDHVPVVDQKEAVGHSVRAVYQYTGMADVAALTGNADYINAINTIWNDVASTKLYITGGIGAEGGHEGFGGPYELPNMSAYCETCASIANVLWNHRMFLMHGDAKYIDVLEKTMVNAALSGISMEGDLFFYPNVLESNGQHARSPWFGCACCPSNVARFIPSIPGFAYASKGRDVWVNLYLGGNVTIDTQENHVRLVQETRYPWSGQVKIAVEPEKEETFAVYVRIPGWAGNQPVPSDLYSFVDQNPGDVSLKINGTQVALEISRGYARLNRTWREGDTIELDLPMPVRRVTSHAKVTSNRGKVALQRGPVVYCLEGPDNDGRIFDLVIPDDAELAAQFRPDLLGGVMTIHGQAETARRTLDGHIVPDGKRPFVAIPYYAWAHRGRAPMTVWPARVLEAARPKPAGTRAYLSKTTASFVHASLDAIKDQNVPASSADSSSLQLDFWPHKGTTEWVQFEWDQVQELSRLKVYWFDDTGRGECHLPKSWRALYQDAEGQFQPVTNRGPYPVQKDTFNSVDFDPVSTKALKIEIVLQENWSAGIQEVVIE
ncbi:MAG: glycoside hydrolase family 127 protein [Pirellulales bacterium]|nr:glycoside hydrolase family 127 protein [Pirellulales bacterium]